MGRFLAIGFLLCFGQSLVWAETENVYFVVSKTLELRPPPNVGTISSTVWRDSKGLVVEWRKGDANVTIYQDYMGRATLNTTTGHLEIKNMAQKDAVEYTVEINDVLLDNKYVAKAIEEVPKPSVWARPEGEKLMLTCVGDVEKAGPVTYWWDTKEDGEWVKLEQIVPIQKNETTQKIETFSCKMKNPVSEKESKPEDNPWFIKPQETVNTAAIVAIVVILLLVGCAIAAFIMRDAIKAKCGTCLGSNEAAVNNSADSPKNETEVALNPKEGTAG